MFVIHYLRLLFRNPYWIGAQHPRRSEGVSRATEKVRVQYFSSQHECECFAVPRRVSLSLGSISPKAASSEAERRGNAAADEVLARHLLRHQSMRLSVLVALACCRRHMCRRHTCRPTLTGHAHEISDCIPPRANLALQS